MKLQKVMIALGLSTCLVGSQVLAVAAQEQPAVQQEAAAEPADQNRAAGPESVTEATAQEEPGAKPAVQEESATEPAVQEEPEAEPAVQEEPATEPAVEEQPVTEPETQTDESGETSGTASDSGTATETPGEETSGTEVTDPGNSADQETGEDTAPEEREGTGEGESQADQETAEDTAPGIGDEESTDTGVKEQEESTVQQDTAEQQPAAPEEIHLTDQTSVMQQYKINPDRILPDTVLDMEMFLPSEKFPDDRDKIKYNVDLPLENIPSFITQEMIVGALKCQDETGYPASVTIAQIIQESGYGKYGPGGEEGEGLSYLAYQYNNIFGIKGTGPAGSVDMRTGEQTPEGIGYTITSGFRVYNTYTECIEDRAELLGRVYKDLTAGVEDANTFAIKVGSRWATDIDYGLTLIRVMERYDLYRLDEMTLGEFSDMLGTFVHPCPGAVLTSDFGYRTAPTAGASTNHKGIDLGTGEYNIPTYAAAEGTVTFAGEAGSAGMMIVIDHGDGLVTKYMHHDKIYVKEGDEVEKGQQIGLSGTTGVSTGNHLHFQVEQNGEAVNPLDYLNLEKNQ